MAEQNDAQAETLAEFEEWIATLGRDMELALVRWPNEKLTMLRRAFFAGRTAGIKRALAIVDSVVFTRTETTTETGDE